MINLIPPDAQKEVRREYWIRVVSVWLVLVGVAFVALTIVQVPIYILLKNQLAAYQSDFASASDRQEQFSEAKTALERANAVATLRTILIGTSVLRQTGTSWCRGCELLIYAQGN
jgi:p-aminobenzoyl-glutamate transporter AbgT